LLLYREFESIGGVVHTHVPNPRHVRIYDRLYRLYRRLHDIFGTQTYTDNLYDLMKELLDIRDKVRAGEM
jgi:L-ribulokinase